MSFTFEVLKFDKSSEVNPEHLLNIKDISVTLLVLKLLTFRDFKLEHPSNIPEDPVFSSSSPILVTLLVSKLLRSRDIRLLHPPNIDPISVTLLVSNSFKSSDFIYLNP